MKSKRSSLLELLNRIDWQAVEGKRGAKLKLGFNEVKVILSRSNKKSPKVDYVTIRLGRDVMGALNWMHGDKVVPMYLEDDQMVFLLVKSHTGQGYIIGKEKHTHACKINFKWDHKLILNEMPATSVHHQAYHDKLIFRIEDGKDD